MALADAVAVTHAAFRNSCRLLTTFMAWRGLAP